MHHHHQVSPEEGVGGVYVYSVFVYMYMYAL